MANVLVDETSLQSIANAIREKNGTEDTYKPLQMPQAILDIESGSGSNELFEALVDGSISGDVVIQAESIRANAFSRCLNLESLSAGKAKTMGNTACNNCENLLKVSFPELTAFSVQAFYNCPKLTHIYAPKATSTSTGTFQGCTSLEILKLPSLTNATSNAFQNCTALRIVKLNALKTISTSVFNNCSNLQALIIGTTNCTLSNANVLTGTPIASGTGFIYVPDEAVETYKTATNWNTYASQIKGLSEIPQDILDELEAYNYGN